MKRWIGNSIALSLALIVGVLTVFASLRYLKEPQVPLDWAVLALSAVMSAVITFFITWGHFQDEPAVRRS